MPIYYTASIVTKTVSELEFIENKMATPTNSVPGIPDREVPKDPTIARYFDKIGTYYLTLSEYAALDNDPNIIGKSLSYKDTSSYEDVFINSYPITTLNTSSEYFSSTQRQSLEEAALDSIQPSDGSLGRWGPSNQSGDITASANFNLKYLTADPSTQYSGSVGDNPSSPSSQMPGNATFDQYWASPNSRTNTITSSYDYVLDGTGVDLIVMDSSFNHLHCDFFDKNGNSRIQYVNWYELTGQPERASEQPKFLYMNRNSTRSHGTMTLSLAGGLLNGFAKNATLYIIPTSISLQGANTNNVFSIDEAMGVVKRFHESKSIDTSTGYKRPTVVNLSQGSKAKLESYVTLYPTRNNVQGQPAVGFINETYSASIDLKLNENEGIRFQHTKMNYVFISSSAVTHPTGSQSYFKGFEPLGWYAHTFTGSLDNLVTQINNCTNNNPYNASFNPEMAGFFVTCSINGNTLSLTSSFTMEEDTPSPYWRYLSSSLQRSHVSIYTGSFNPNNNFHPFTNGIIDLTGSFEGYLGAPSDFITHITEVVTDGESFSNGNNTNMSVENFLNPYPDKDPWGNPPVGYSPWNFYWMENQGVGAATYRVDNAIINESFQECASAGVVICTSAGNEGNHLASTGSLDHNPFYDPDQYDPKISENYFTYDVDSYYGPAGTPIYYQRAQPSNGSAIQVGNGPNNQQSGRSIWLDPTQDVGRSLQAAGCVGPGVDIFAPGQGGYYGCGATYNPTDSRGFNTAHTLKDINFDFSSSLAKIASSFNDAYTRSIFFATGSTRYISDSSGTSASSPMVAGVICCFLQMNPWADTNDVRKWLKSMPASIANSTTPLDRGVLMFKSSFIDITGSHKSTLPASQSFQYGINASPKIMNFPFHSSSPITFNRVVLDNVNFKSQS